MVLLYFFFLPSLGLGKIDRLIKSHFTSTLNSLSYVRYNVNLIENKIIKKTIIARITYNAAKQKHLDS